MNPELRLRLEAIASYVAHALAGECEPSFALDAVIGLARAAESYVP